MHIFSFMFIQHIFFFSVRNPSFITYDCQQRMPICWGSSGGLMGISIKVLLTLGWQCISLGRHLPQLHQFCPQDNKERFSPEAVDKVLHHFHADDCLVSVASEKEAVTHNLVSICAAGGFQITKWISNRHDVLAAIPESHRAKEMKGLNMDQDLLPVERVLGIEWCIQSDTFKFRIVIEDRPFTRRGILSQLHLWSSWYFESCCPVCEEDLKGSMQESTWLGWCQDWVAQEWASWLDELCHLEKCNIMRCLKPLDFGEVITAQLHDFCDASKDGYGVVTYLLSCNACSQVHSAFVMGKARVAPLKSVTIPWTELIAANMASRMDILWRKELHMYLQKSVFWTASASVLTYPIHYPSVKHPLHHHHHPVNCAVVCMQVLLLSY